MATTELSYINRLADRVLRLTLFHSQLENHITPLGHIRQLKHSFSEIAESLSLAMDNHLADPRGYRLKLAAAGTLLEDLIRWRPAT